MDAAEEIMKSKEQALTPEAKFVINIFRKEKIDEFLDNLTEEQKKFIYIFVSGFQAGIEKKIVGIYSKDYIETRELTDDILNSYGIKIKQIAVNDLNLNFMIVWQ